MSRVKKFLIGLFVVILILVGYFTWRFFTSKSYVKNLESKFFESKEKLEKSQNIVTKLNPNATLKEWISQMKDLSDYRGNIQSGAKSIDSIYGTKTSLTSELISRVGNYSDEFSKYNDEYQRIAEYFSRVIQSYEDYSKYSDLNDNYTNKPIVVSGDRKKTIENLDTRVREYKGMRDSFIKDLSVLKNVSPPADLKVNHQVIVLIVESLRDDADLTAQSYEKLREYMDKNDKALLTKAQDLASQASTSINANLVKVKALQELMNKEVKDLAKALDDLQFKAEAAGAKVEDELDGILTLENNLRFP